MKKMNKKGFTLAELLIVIAIIAVLIAIAIPTFSGALENARRQTDHANIRSAYSVMQVAKMSGGLPTDGGTVTPVTTSTTWYMQKDGTFVVSTLANTTNSYKLKAGSDSVSCADCAGCTAANHTAGNYITIVYTAASTTGGSTTPASWALTLTSTAPSGT